MNVRERVLAAIQRKTLDRFPSDIWATPEVWAKLRKYLGVNDNLQVYEELAIDGIFEILPPYVGSLRKNENGIHYNEWGMGFRAQSYGAGVYDEQVVYPLAKAETIADLEVYPWPSPDDYDYSFIQKFADEHAGRVISCGYTAVFYYHNLLRGLERSMMDPIEKPEFTHYLVKTISNIFTEFHRRCFEAGNGRIDLTQVTDDFGSQRGLLISPRLFDQFYRQPIQRGIDLAHSYGLMVFHHDDGDMRSLLPRLVQMGIDILNPIQWRCGDWDLASLKSEFGSQLCFHGAIDNQYTLPFGTPQEVKDEVRRMKETLGQDGTGYIIAPCHNIQSNTPVENIIAMYEAVRE